MQFILDLQISPDAATHLTRQPIYRQAVSTSGDRDGDRRRSAALGGARRRSTALDGTRRRSTEISPRPVRCPASYVRRPDACGEPVGT
jgi:hypothetical protein